MNSAGWGSAHSTNYTAVSADVDDTLFQNDVFYTNSMGNTGARMARPEAWAKNGCGIGGFLHHNNVNPADDCWCRHSGRRAPVCDVSVASA